MNEENKTDDVKNKITISADDCANVLKYCTHFSVPSAPDLEKALEIFSKDVTFENQENVKLEICKWITTCKHESFTDSLWDAPKKAAEEVVFDLQFNKSLNDHLSAKSEETGE